MASPVEELDAQLSKVNFAFVVFYRGSWCPFCMAYLKDLQSLLQPIDAVNGTTIIVTAEPESRLPASRATSGYTGSAIVDPDNVLAAELRQRGLVNVAISEKSGYPHGMAQPEVLVLKKDGSVLYSWAVVPSMMNLGGAKDRPVLKEVWENVAADLRGQSPVHKKYSKTTFTGMVWGKVFG